MRRRKEERKKSGYTLPTPQWMKDDELRGNHYLKQHDQVAHDTEMKWGYGRLKKLVPYELAERFDRQRKLMNSAFAEGGIEDVQTQVEATIRGWQKLEAVALELGHKIQDPHFMEVQLDDGTLVAITNCDNAKKERLADARDIIVYDVLEAARHITSWSANEPLQAIFKHFPGAKIDKVTAIEEPLNDDIPF
tara:strand:- start:1932 stop:2507 length:576 start_codon:yes stop_codon:yes gene_type:complete